MKRIPLLLLAFILAAGVPNAVWTLDADAVSESTRSSFRIRYTATFTNVDSSMERVVVYLPVPSEWDSQKDAQIEEITPEPTSINEDPDHGNKMVYFLLPNGIPKNQSREFTIQYTFTFHETHVSVDPAKIASYNTSDPTYIKYTKQSPADEVQSNDPIIRNAASEIVGEETNAYLRAKLVYNWIVANIQYEFPSPVGAKETYMKRAGDCGDYTALLCAMVISQGIPCRAVAGLFFSPPFPRTYSDRDHPTDPNAYGSHVYAELYLPYYGWLPVDASIGRSSGKPDSYFGNTWDFFLINSKGYGIRLVPSAKGVQKVETLQHYQWWFWGDAHRYDSYFTYTVDKLIIPIQEKASESLDLAEYAVWKAEQQGRTEGLDPAREKLDEAKQAFDHEAYDSAISLAQEATELAEKARMPETKTTFTTSSITMELSDRLQTDWPYLVIALVVATIAIVFVTRRLRKKP
jgi:transglutaminase-like putative cysteine protease